MCLITTEQMISHLREMVSSWNWVNIAVYSKIQESIAKTLDVVCTGQELEDSELGQ